MRIPVLKGVRHLLDVCRHQLGLLAPCRAPTQSWKIRAWKSGHSLLYALHSEAVSNCSERIWAVVGVVGDIFDALLYPDPLLVQLAFPESQVVQLGLEVDQLICYFSSVTAWAYTPETPETCILSNAQCLVKTFYFIPVYATQMLGANPLLMPFIHGFMLCTLASVLRQRRALGADWFVATLSPSISRALLEVTNGEPTSTGCCS